MVPFMNALLVEQLAQLGAEASGHADEARVLSDRVDGVVVRVGDVVVKAHPDDADAASLELRLALARSAPLRDVFVEAVGAPALRRVGARCVTLWRAGEPVDPQEPDAAPWEHAATLLARLHSVPLGHLAGFGPLPAAGAPRRVARAMERLGEASGQDADVVRRARATLGEADALVDGRDARPRTLTHGDFHLGQLVRVPSSRDSGWRLVDVDDLGVGDPAWDLARPAAWFALGMLPRPAWQRFLEVYCASGGIALPSARDPWPALDLPARAVTIQAAAIAVAKARADECALDEIEQELVHACERMVTAPWSRSPC
jgi:aminoglycoside phosphotransferase (APT) family kinase protein